MRSGHQVPDFDHSSLSPAPPPRLRTHRRNWALRSDQRNTPSYATGVTRHDRLGYSGERVSGAPRVRDRRVGVSQQRRERGCRRDRQHALQHLRRGCPRTQQLAGKIRPHCRAQPADRHGRACAETSTAKSLILFDSFCEWRINRGIRTANTTSCALYLTHPIRGVTFTTATKQNTAKVLNISRLQNAAGSPAGYISSARVVSFTPGEEPIRRHRHRRFFIKLEGVLPMATIPNQTRTQSTAQPASVRQMTAPRPSSGLASRVTIPRACMRVVW